MLCRKGFIWQCHRARVLACLFPALLTFQECPFSSSFRVSLVLTFALLFRPVRPPCPLTNVPPPAPTAPGPPTPPAAVSVVEPRGRRRGAAPRTDSAPRSAPSAAAWGCPARPALCKPPWPVSDPRALLELGTASRQGLGNDLLSSLWRKDNGPEAD